MARVTLAMSLPTTPTGRRGELSARQLEALRLTASGLQYREIAVVMGVTYHGVHQLLRGAYARLGVEGRIEAYRVMGWLDVGVE